MLPSSVASLQARHPVADSFLTGVLAVAVASPCTAPFMGRLHGPHGHTACRAGAGGVCSPGPGSGVALPGRQPVARRGRALPRPGAWMDTFRRFLAFPMFATVVWLVWVLGQQSGIDGAAAC